MPGLIFLCKTLTQTVKNDIKVVKNNVKLILGIAIDITEVLVKVDKITLTKTSMTARMNKLYSSFNLQII